MLTETYPILGRDRLSAVESAVAQDESALWGTSAADTNVDVQLAGLTAPAAPTVTQGGTTGSTNYSYIVADVGNVGVAASSATQTTTGNATLSSTNYNIISWAPIPGHTYNLYRSASSGTPSTTGLLYTITAPLVALGQANPALVFNDTGSVTPTSAAPTSNLTGAVSGTGPVFQGGLPTSSSTTSGITLTAAMMLSPVFVRSGPSSAGFTDTTPTAAALVAAVPGVKVGASYEFKYRNTSNQTATIGAGSGVTLATGNTNTIITVNTRIFIAVFTNVTIGSEAVTVYTGPASAH